MVDHEIEVALRWSDMDVLRHVNNVSMLRLLEEARVRFLAEYVAGSGVRRPTMFVAHHEIDYAQPLVYSQEPVRIAMRVTRIGGSGFDLGCTVFTPDGAVAALAETSMVVVDGAASGRPAPIADDLRAVLEGLRGEPVALRRRRAAAGIS